jgi:hypothetical protein
MFVRRGERGEISRSRRRWYALTLLLFLVPYAAAAPTKSPSKSSKSSSTSRSTKSTAKGKKPPLTAPRDERELEAFVDRCKRERRPFKLSLREITQEYLRAQERGGPIPPEVRYLRGFTWFFGYAIDRDNHDIVLLGIQDPSRPRIDIDCLVTAVRSAYGGITPGCSLDPHPNPKYQKVRIDGIPWNTRWATVMIDADYDMKKICQGQIKSGVKGVPSHSEMNIPRANRMFDRNPYNRAAWKEFDQVNRFWFNRPYQEVPRTLRIGEDGDVVLLYRNPVVVMTEKQLQGIFGTGVQSPTATRWAAAFSKYMTALGKKHRSINELLTLYRLLDLMAHLRQANAIVPNVDFYVSGYQPPYKGPPAVKKTLTRKIQWTSGRWSRSFRVSGGVRMPVEVDPSTFENRPAPAALKSKLLAD